MTFANRVLHLQPEGAYEMLARASTLEAAGRDIIHLEIGQPDFPTFAHISLAGIAAIANGHTRYNPPEGLSKLREVIADDAGRRRGMKIRPQQVVIAPGTKPGLFFTTLALVEPGDEVLYPDPGFPTYSAMIGVAGGRPVPIPLREEKSFSFDLDAFDECLSDRTRLIVLNSPGNPTGGVMPPADLEHIASAVLERNCWVLSDEIYARLVYEGKSAPSIAALADMAERTIIVDGFSKTYAMTGWRLGYAIMPEALAEQMALVLTHATGCTATFTQLAGVEALLSSQDGVDEVLADYQRRRDRIVSGLNEIPGIQCQTPAGAFYVFPNITHFGLPARDLAHRLLDEAGVATLPGTDFGPNGEGYLRLCYAASMDEIDEALERMAAFFSQW